jgi:phenylalanyl-tRNA synthetase beta chain
MKTTYNWLKEYVDFDWSPAELSERLTMLGVEVEGMEKVGGAFEGIVVGQVITRDQHPNADRLTLCRVTNGCSELQIVCGATNFKAGDKVALALPGTSMPVPEGEKPFVLKTGKIRGEKSEGMMCSGKELQLSDDHVAPGHSSMLRERLPHQRVLRQNQDSLVVIRQL